MSYFSVKPFYFLNILVGVRHLLITVKDGGSTLEKIGQNTNKLDLTKVVRNFFHLPLTPYMKET